MEGTRAGPALELLLWAPIVQDKFCFCHGERGEGEGKVKPEEREQSVKYASVRKVSFRPNLKFIMGKSTIG